MFIPEVNSTRVDQLFALKKWTVEPRNYHFLRLCQLSVSSSQHKASSASLLASHLLETYQGIEILYFPLEIIYHSYLRISLRTKCSHLLYWSPSISLHWGQWVSFGRHSLKLIGINTR